jgi:dienelactone hydrolase
VPAGSVPTATGSLQLGDYFIDRFEVTNRDFKKFIDAGGYRKGEYWTEPFMRDGRTIAWNDAMAEFRDATGRPGPSTWELGTFPEGQDDYPVRGISWYEAAAFARFAGKALPTVHHWRNAAGLGVFSDILEASNFTGKGPARAGEYPGMGPYGTYDMAGNVKEWCWNGVGDRRYILGGGWNEPNYQFRGDDARLPFDRSANNGFRTIKLKDSSAPSEAALRPVERLTRDYSAEKPVGDNVFRTYESLYGYDPADLAAKVESVDESSPSWRVERITYAAAYGNDRIIAYLFLPRHAAPPYHTVVYFPHSGATVLRSFEKGEMSYLGFIVKAGHALLLPMYKGTYERRLTPPPSGPNALRDVTIQQMKDLRRSVDYLETRPDIDRERLAYFGVSLGARLGAIALAVEKRFKTAVFWSGGFGLSPKLPEVDELNYAPRVTTPVLMLNGRDDFTFPIDSSQLPMFRLLGTPDKDKRRVLYDGGHVFPFARVEKDTLDWLDRYLGVPR